MALNQEHIGYIIKDLHYRGIVLEECQDEIIDHVCSAVEATMENGVRFIDAYHIVLKSFGRDTGLRNIQHQIVQTETNTSTLMLRNYFKVAFRNLSRQRFFSFINISGLALGIASCLLIVLYISHELSFDKHHAHADRIYRVNGEIKYGENHYQLAVAPAPLAAAMLQEFPGIETAVRFRSRGSYLVKRTDAVESFREHRVIWTDSTFFDVFSVPVLSGNPDNALKDPNTIAISKSMAEKYFSGEEAIGRSLILDNDIHTKVTAVFEDMPETGHFRFDILISMAGLDEAESTNFLSNNFNTYLLLHPQASAETLESGLPAFVMKYVGPQAAQAIGGEFTMEKFLASGNKLEYTLMPLGDIHLHSDLTAELGVNNDVTYIYLFGAVALFILGIACINFMNLSTARSANRAREVGLRKVMGSLRHHLVRQFLTESVLLSALAFVLAVGIALVALPYFNVISRLSLRLPLESPGFYAILTGAAIVVGVLAGLYPSFFLSAFEPARVLKGKLALGARSGTIRGTLVVFQFAISIFLIIGTITVHRQLNFIQNKKIGFNKDQVIMVSDLYALGDEAESFKNQVLQNTWISSGTISGFIPVSDGWRNDNTFWPGDAAPTQETMVGMQNWDVDYDYIRTMGMKIIEGRDFSRDFPSDSGAVVLNQTAVDHFRLGDEPVGKRISTFAQNNPDGTVNNSTLQHFTVIGVVEDFHFESLKQNISPLGLFLGRSPGYASFRFQAQNTREVIAVLQDTWKKLAPGQPFQYSFLDESFGRM